MKRLAVLAALLLAVVPAVPGSGEPAVTGRIAYSEYRDRDFRLMIARADGTAPRRAHPGDWSMDPAWGPDGRSLAFSGYRPGVRVGNAQILVLDTRTGRSRQVSVGSGYKRFPSWAPDGRSLVYAALVPAEPAHPPLVPRPYAATCELRIIDLAARRERVLHAFGVFAVVGGASVLDAACATYPAWSPSGDAIAFTQPMNVHTPAASSRIPEPIFLVAPDGTGLRRAPGNLAGLAPKWSPDGRALLFSGPVAQAGSEWALQVVDLDDGRRRLLVRAPYRPAFADFSPDGRQVVFQAHHPDVGVTRLYRVPASGAAAPVPVMSGNVLQVLPDWGS